MKRLLPILVLFVLLLSTSCTKAQAPINYLHQVDEILFFLGVDYDNAINRYNDLNDYYNELVNAPVPDPPLSPEEVAELTEALDNADLELIIMVGWFTPIATYYEEIWNIRKQIATMQTNGATQQEIFPWYIIAGQKELQFNACIYQANLHGNNVQLYLDFYSCVVSYIASIVLAL